MKMPDAVQEAIQQHCRMTMGWPGSGPGTCIIHDIYWPEGQSYCNDPTAEAWYWVWILQARVTLLANKIDGHSELETDRAEFRSASSGSWHDTADEVRGLLK